MASSGTHSASNSANITSPPDPAAPIITDTIPPQDVMEKKPALILPFVYMNTKEEIEKYNKYEADYTRRLKAKYFSDKDIFGGNIYEEKATSDSHTYKASKWPGTKSYVDPLSFLEDQSGRTSN